MASVKSQSLNNAFVLKNEIEQNVPQQNNKYSNIEYKKTNPFIFGNYSSNEKFHKWYNFAKFFIVIVAFIFCLLSLWFATQWKKNALSNIGIDLISLGKFDPSSVDPQITKALSLSLSDWQNSQFSSGILGGLVALCFIGLILIITSLIFKNGTALSVTSISLLLIVTIIVIIFFSIGLNTQQEVVSIYNSAQADDVKINKILTIVLGTIK